VFKADLCTSSGNLAIDSSGTMNLSIKTISQVVLRYDVELYGAIGQKLLICGILAFPG
jgi:hypothetical protein